MAKKTDLAAIVRSAGGGTRHRETQIAEPERRDEKSPYRQPGRQGTKPVTGHFPGVVRNQLKILAIEQETTLQELLAEAFNDLFAKYGKPEIVPSNKR